MTGAGTNQYLLGRGEVTLIDVAPYDAENARRLAGALEGRLAQILLTHVHPDHVGGARAVADATGAAGLTVQAHLQKLIAEGVVVEEPGARYRLAR